eukprot:TRINITY_DN15425_c0_g1_i1.p1 TRINITY_DN15425_c0_g1~~TRINITY_DN15425_c0_g1_i1.p1  ORF type:complete len:410 (-),score=38.85 TRINITY_DN15425_c0_g1_i1:80-1309(-)
MVKKALWWLLLSVSLCQTYRFPSEASDRARTRGQHGLSGRSKQKRQEKVRECCCLDPHAMCQAVVVVLGDSWIPTCLQGHTVDKPTPLKDTQVRINANEDDGLEFFSCAEDTENKTRIRSKKPCVFDVLRYKLYEMLHPTDPFEDPEEGGPEYDHLFVQQGTGAKRSSSTTERDANSPAGAKNSSSTKKLDESNPDFTGKWVLKSMYVLNKDRKLSSFQELSIKKGQGWVMNGLASKVDSGALQPMQELRFKPLRDSKGREGLLMQTENFGTAAYWAEKFGRPKVVQFFLPNVYPDTEDRNPSKPKLYQAQLQVGDFDSMQQPRFAEDKNTYLNVHESAWISSDSDANCKTCQRSKHTKVFRSAAADKMSKDKPTLSFRVLESSTLMINENYDPDLSWSIVREFEKTDA